jgi:hypothetical protein
MFWESFLPFLTSRRPADRKLFSKKSEKGVDICAGGVYNGLVPRGKGKEGFEMTRNEMIARYNALAVATAYIVGFVLDGLLYYTMSAHIADEFLKLDRMSSKRGGWAKIRVKLTASDRKGLVMGGKAVLIGSADLLDTADKYNKGERFERIITETLTGEKWVKDSVPFNVAGDITLNGEQVQIKFDGAELTNERMLMRIA